MIQVKISSVIEKLKVHPTALISEVDIQALLVLIEKEEESQWLGRPPIKKSTIQAPPHQYIKFDQYGKRVVARDYFRSLGECGPDEEVKVMVQAGLTPRFIQKNIDNMLSEVKNSKFNSFTTETSTGCVLVTFS